MLKLKPSAKLRRRYLLVNGSKEDIEKSILDYIGILGWSRAAPFFVKKQGNSWILAVSRKELDNVKSSFAVYSGKIEVIKISGTLKGLEKK